MDFCSNLGPGGSCLFADLSTNCSYNPKFHERGFTPIPESALASIHSSNNCAWLEDIITRNYTTQDVWRDLLPANIYNPNSTNCYGEQYMDYLNLSSARDKDYSSRHFWLIPRGLSLLADTCVVKACRAAGATGNPDITGVGVRRFFFSEISSRSQRYS